MALEHSSLTDLFDDIASAIKEKTSSTTSIVADQFPDAIKNIPTGPDHVIKQVYYNGASFQYDFGEANTTFETFCNSQFNVVLDKPLFIIKNNQLHINLLNGQEEPLPIISYGTEIPIPADMYTDQIGYLQIYNDTPISFTIVALEQIYPCKATADESTFSAWLSGSSQGSENFTTKMVADKTFVKLKDDTQTILIKNRSGDNFVEADSDAIAGGITFHGIKAVEFSLSKSTWPQPQSLVAPAGYSWNDYITSAYFGHDNFTVNAEGYVLYGDGILINSNQQIVTADDLIGDQEYLVGGSLISFEVPRSDTHRTKTYITTEDYNTFDTWIQSGLAGSEDFSVGPNDWVQYKYKEDDKYYFLTSDSSYRFIHKTDTIWEEQVFPATQSTRFSINNEHFYSLNTYNDLLDRWVNQSFSSFIDDGIQPGSDRFGYDEGYITCDGDRIKTSDGEYADFGTACAGEFTKVNMLYFKVDSDNFIVENPYNRDLAWAEFIQMSAGKDFADDGPDGNITYKGQQIFYNDNVVWGAESIVNHGEYTTASEPPVDLITFYVSGGLPTTITCTAEKGMTFESWIADGTGKGVGNFQISTQDTIELKGGYMGQKLFLQNSKYFSGLIQKTDTIIDGYTYDLASCIIFYVGPAMHPDEKVSYIAFTGSSVGKTWQDYLTTMLPGHADFKKDSNNVICWTRNPQEPQLLYPSGSKNVYSTESIQSETRYKLSGL